MNSIRAGLGELNPLEGLKNGKARHLQIKSIKEMKALLQVIEHELQTSS
jgi:hypothetical protein